MQLRLRCEAIKRPLAKSLASLKLFNILTKFIAIIREIICYKFDKFGTILLKYVNMMRLLVYDTNYRVGQKKVSLRSLHITSSNTDRFSKFFHCHILQEICNKVIIKHSTSPQTCRYTTLWNICVRKLINQWNLSHRFLSQNWNIMNICNIPDQCCW